MAAEDDGFEQTLISRRGARPMQPEPEPEPIGHFLAFMRGEELHRVPIGAAGVTIGRVAPCDVVIAQPEISRRHCRIDIEGSAAVLTDLGATNGTFLGGRQVDRPTPLSNGNRISLGSFPVRYEQRDPAQLAEEATLAAEIRRAAEYVRAILPQPITAGPVRADWWFVPSSHLGGDAFGYQFLDEGCFTGFLLDVSGHGIGSAMHAANVANVLRRRVLPGVDFRDPAQVAAGLNDAFPMEQHNELMLTLWYFVHDIGARRLRFCAAGHHPALLAAPGSAEPAALWQRGPTIGMLPQGRWAGGEAAVPPGSRLYLFSDGAFEVAGPDGRAWEIGDLARIITDGGAGDAGELCRAIRAAARPGPLEDDFSMLVVRFQ